MLKQKVSTTMERRVEVEIPLALILEYLRGLGLRIDDTQVSSVQISTYMYSTPKTFVASWVIGREEFSEEREIGVDVRMPSLLKEE